MRTKVFYEDLNADVQSRIRWAILHDLTQEIEEAVQNGLNRETAEQELVADYINRNNTGCAFEL